MNVSLRKWEKEDGDNLSKLLSNKKILDNLRDGLPYPYTKEDECVAFFINLPAKYGYISMYSHIGQHDEASLEYYQSTKKASPEQYKELYKELQSVYDDCILEIKQSMNYDTLRRQWE